MSLIELRTDPSRKELAWFGLLLLAFLGLIGLLVWSATGTLGASRYIWGAGLVLAAFYYAVPALRKSMFLGWMYAAYPIGWVVSHVLLAIIFFGLLTPIGLVLRAVGYDPMQRRLDRDAKSYWVRRDAQTDPARYFRQF
jgi:hypothetical protein